MRDRIIQAAALALPLLLTGCATNTPTQTASPTPQPAAELRPGPDTAYGVGGTAQLFPSMGDYGRTVTTQSGLAQHYFDQGMKWMFGFNHDEAVRAFNRAAEIDTRCAMAWWGVAYAQGPNYNGLNMNRARQDAAWEATQKAIAQLDDETPVEQALVRALLVRYQDPATSEKIDQKKNAADYAEALAKLRDRFPDDNDIAVLYAEALMLKHPWQLHKPDGSPRREETQTIIRVLEEALAADPTHPAANHLYIHAVEASSDKRRAIPAADRLSTLVPMSGHLTHMPSHLYAQVGMWQRAIDQNIMAMRSDRLYLERSPQHYRQHGYIAHNGHMLAFVAMMVGQEQTAMAGARAVWDMPPHAFETIGKRYDHAMCAVYEVMRRFGRWDDILAEPAPPDILFLSTAAWRSCRAVAYAAKKDFKNAAKEQAAFREMLKQKPKHKYLLLNEHFIAAEIALQQEQWDEAISQLAEAMKHETAMGYGEPPRWNQPVRHTLGAVYLKAGRFEDAEQAYREDLQRWPGNGWSLFGLSRALEGQGKNDEAKSALAEFERAWSNADIPLQTSCKCIPKL